jgi:murein L,D-transpeptidase YcbB/YkuD
MVVLRIAFLVAAWAAIVQPATAADDTALFGARDSDVRWSQVSARLASAKVQAVEAALEAAKDSGDPIEKHVLDGVRGFYEARGFTTLWFGADAPSPQMAELRRSMDEADLYGLDPATYATPSFEDRRYYDPQRLAQADVEFSRAVARFVTHISSGRIRPTDISKLITLQPERPDIGEALLTLSHASSADEALASYEPQHKQYKALKAKLAALRALGAEDDRIVVPDGALLKPGKSDERVSLLRARLDVDLAPEAEADLYDEALVDAVKAFQEENGLSVDGIVGPRTLLALNGISREEAIASIIANLTRWRWMPRDLGAFYVMVNVPEFLVRVVDDGSVVHETRVVVGKPTNRTPTFSNTMSHVVVNPYWNVPVSIVRNEMMSQIRANPYGYFARHGYQVFANINGRMRQVNPTRINWYAVSASSVRIRQVPGAHNALGRIKFMFPNQHSVYLHDTPSKSLFSRDRRAFSHGCVRVQNPLDFADAILPHAAPDWNSSRLERLFGGNERRVNLDNPIPVHLAYFTATVDADGELRHFEDIYGYDGKMTAYLGS